MTARKATRKEYRYCMHQLQNLSLNCKQTLPEVWLHKMVAKVLAGKLADDKANVHALCTLTKNFTAQYAVPIFLH